MVPPDVLWLHVKAYYPDFQMSQLFVPVLVCHVDVNCKQKCWCVSLIWIRNRNCYCTFPVPVGVRRVDTLYFLDCLKLRMQHARMKCWLACAFYLGDIYDIVLLIFRCGSDLWLRITWELVSILMHRCPFVSFWHKDNLKARIIFNAHCPPGSCGKDVFAQRES